MFFKQLNRYRKSFNIDIEIEKINDECKQEINNLEEASKTWQQGRHDSSIGTQKEHKARDIYINRLKSLCRLAEKIKVAPEIAKTDEYSNSLENKEEGDRLENRLRYYIVQRQSLFIGGIALLVAFFTLLFSIVALAMAIVSR